jgi:hypothetical protein
MVDIPTPPQPEVFWMPQEDITLWELAKCLPAFTAYTMNAWSYIETLPDSCSRHFIVR